MTQMYFMFITVGLTISLYWSFKHYHDSSSKEMFYFYLSLAYLIYIVVTVFRPMGSGLGGTDTWGYRNYFMNASGSLQHGLSVQFYERGYAIFVWLVRVFTSNYRVFLFIVHSFIFVSMVSFLKNTPFNKYSVITILALVFLALDSINIIRIILAVCMSYYVYILLLKKKIVFALILNIAMCFVHVSAVIVLVVCLVAIIVEYDHEFSLGKLMILIALLMIGTFIAIHLLDSIINQTKYVFYDADEGIAFPSYIMFLIVFVVSVIKYDDLIKLNPDNKLFIYILPVCLVVFPLQFRYAVMYRMILFLHPVLYVLIPNILKVYSGTNKERVYSNAVRFLMMVFVVYRIYSFFTSEIVDLGSFGFSISSASALFRIVSGF